MRVADARRDIATELVLALGTIESVEVDAKCRSVEPPERISGDVDRVMGVEEVGRSGFGDDVRSGTLLLLLFVRKGDFDRCGRCWARLLTLTLTLRDAVPLITLPLLIGGASPVGELVADRRKPESAGAIT